MSKPPYILDLLACSTPGGPGYVAASVAKPTEELPDVDDFRAVPPRGGPSFTRRVLAILREYGPQMTNTIAARLDMAPKDAAPSLRLMRKNGHITSSTDGGQQLRWAAATPKKPLDGRQKDDDDE